VASPEMAGVCPRHDPEPHRGAVCPGAKDEVEIARAGARRNIELDDGSSVDRRVRVELIPVATRHSVEPEPQGRRTPGPERSGENAAPSHLARSHERPPLS